MPEIRYEGREERLDKLLVSGTLTRSRAAALIHEERVTVNGIVVDHPSFKPKYGDIVAVNIPDTEDTANIAENIPITLLYEDESLAVVIKPCGMVVHPAAGNLQGTLVNALLAHCSDLSGINGVIRPGIVHRLDKETSGAMLVAKTDLAHVSLAEQIRSHSAGRIYLAVVYGNLVADAGRIEGAIGRHPKDRKKMAVVRQLGKPAVTHFQVVERLGRYTVVSCRLETGRTHQIRVHMASIGHPLVGDPKYGPAKTEPGIKGQALHSSEIHFTHPRTGETMTFSAPLPQDMKDLIERLRKSR